MAGQRIRSTRFRSFGGSVHLEFPSSPRRSALAVLSDEVGIREGRRMSQDRPRLLQTQQLLREAQQGRRDALEELLARYRPRLERWATGRLPHNARSLLDTGDLVQET